jgi:hypothetical protein
MNMNVQQARTKGYNAGARAALRVPFNAVPELLAIAALKDAIPAQDNFALMNAHQIPTRRLILVHAFRTGVAHGIADTIKKRRE